MAKKIAGHSFKRRIAGNEEGGPPWVPMVEKNLGQGNWKVHPLAKKTRRYFCKKTCQEKNVLILQIPKMTQGND